MNIYAEKKVAQIGYVRYGTLMLKSTELLTNPPLVALSIFTLPLVAPVF